MIDDNLIKRIQHIIDRYEDVHPHLAQELLSNYVKFVEQNAELHKENEKNKSDASKLYELFADSGVCPEFLRVNFAN